MKARSLLLPVAATLVAALLLAPAEAEDKKKKKKSDSEETKEPPKRSVLEQLQDQLRGKTQPAAPVTATGQPVKLRLSNMTGRPVELVWLNPNGRQQSYGELAPTEPGGDPAVIETFSGHQWLFRINGQVLQTYIATTKRDQSLTLGQGRGQVMQIPPVDEPRVIRNPRQPDRGGNLPPPAPQPAGPQSAEAQEFLRVHNRARAEVGAPPLQWSDALARYAQEWADRLAASGDFKHREQSPYGENIFGGSNGFTPVDAAKDWLSERKDYSGGPITQNNFAQVGHYTQMVWRDSTEVGYGFARGRNGVIVVANYSPRGNGIGRKPY